MFLNRINKNKKIKTGVILALVLLFVFVPIHQAYAGGLWDWFGDVGKSLVKTISYLLMTMGGFFLTISGWLFDKVIDYSVINMSTYVNDAQYLGGGIKTAWTTLRDIANIFFIFILLTAFFKSMFKLEGFSINKTVRDVIIIALIINFSAFLTKVPVDASNIVSVGFYNSIAGNTSSSTSGSGTTELKGISAGYMNVLGLQNFYSPDAINNDNSDTGTRIFMIGIMSFILMTIMAGIFLIITAMFVHRFVVVIFAIILSPVAFVSYTIPGLRSHFNEWVESLKSACVFPPVFLALTWVSLKLAKSLNVGLTSSTTLAAATSNYSDSNWSLFLNYVLVVAFAIASLVISKSIASKAKMFKEVTSGVGTAALGTAAFVGRNTVGRASRAVLQSEGLRNLANSEKANPLSRAFAKSTLWTSQKGSQASFDARGTGFIKKYGGDVLGGPSGKGGFADSVKKKADKKAAYAKAVYGQTESEAEKKKEYEDKKKKYDEAREKEEKNIREKQRAEDEEAKKKEGEAKTTNDAAQSEEERLGKEIEAKEKERKDATLRMDVERRDQLATEISEMKRKFEEAKKKSEESGKKLEDAKKRHAETIKALRTDIEEKEFSEDLKILKADHEAKQAVWNAVKDNAANRQKKYAERLERTLGIPTIGGKAAARAVRKGIEGKSKKDKLADLAREVQQEEDAEKKKDKSEQSTEPKTEKESGSEKKTT